MKINVEDHISKEVQDILSGSPDLFLVTVRIKGDARHQQVQVFLDGDEGIDIDQCASVSRQLGARLEEPDIFEGRYRLEVSSPGLDMPLQMMRQYRKNVGRKVKVKKTDGTRVKGRLDEVPDDQTIILVNDKAETIKLLITEIEEAKVTVSFK